MLDLKGLMAPHGFRVMIFACSDFCLNRYVKYFESNVTCKNITLKLSYIYLLKCILLNYSWFLRIWNKKLLL